MRSLEFDRNFGMDHRQSAGYPDRSGAPCGCSPRPGRRPPWPAALRRALASLAKVRRRFKPRPSFRDPIEAGPRPGSAASGADAWGRAGVARRGAARVAPLVEDGDSDGTRPAARRGQLGHLEAARTPDRPSPGPGETL